MPEQKKKKEDTDYLGKIVSSLATIPNQIGDYLTTPPPADYHSETNYRDPDTPFLDGMFGLPDQRRAEHAANMTMEYGQQIMDQSKEQHEMNQMINQQNFDHRKELNPMLIEGQGLINTGNELLNQQRLQDLTHSSELNPMLIESQGLANTGNEILNQQRSQNLEHSGEINPLLIESQGLANTNQSIANEQAIQNYNQDAQMNPLLIQNQEQINQGQNILNQQREQDFYQDQETHTTNQIHDGLVNQQKQMEVDETQNLIAVQNILAQEVQEDMMEGKPINLRNFDTMINEVRDALFKDKDNPDAQSILRLTYNKDVINTIAQSHLYPALVENVNQAQAHLETYDKLDDFFNEDDTSIDVKDSFKQRELAQNDLNTALKELSDYNLRYGNVQDVTDSPNIKSFETTFDGQEGSLILEGDANANLVGFVGKGEGVRYDYLTGKEQKGVDGKIDLPSYNNQEEVAEQRRTLAGTTTTDPELTYPKVLANARELIPERVSEAIQTNSIMSHVHGSIVRGEKAENTEAAILQRFFSEHPREWLQDVITKPTGSPPERFANWVNTTFLQGERTEVQNVYNKGIFWSGVAGTNRTARKVLMAEQDGLARSQGMSPIYRKQLLKQTERDASTYNFNLPIDKQTVNYATELIANYSNPKAYDEEGWTSKVNQSAASYAGVLNRARAMNIKPENVFNKAEGLSPDTIERAKNNMREYEAEIALKTIQERYNINIDERVYKSLMKDPNKQIFGYRDVPGYGDQKESTRFYFLRNVAPGTSAIFSSNHPNLLEPVLVSDEEVKNFVNTWENKKDTITKQGMTKQLYDDEIENIVPFGVREYLTYAKLQY